MRDLPADETQRMQKKCLTLISRIAWKGASSADPERAYDALLELAYALERELVGADLERLHMALDEIDSTDAVTEPLGIPDMLKFQARSTLN
jgi:hypothetical protein